MGNVTDKKYRSIRVPDYIHKELKERSARSGRTIIAEMHLWLFGLEQTHKKAKECDKNGKSKDLRHLPMDEKVDMVLQKMKQLGYTSFRQSKTVDGGFGRACRALGLNYQTERKYWDWLYENKIVPALEAKKDG